MKDQKGFRLAPAQRSAAIPTTPVICLSRLILVMVPNDVFFQQLFRVAKQNCLRRKNKVISPLLHQGKSVMQQCCDFWTLCRIVRPLIPRDENHANIHAD
jgi:hypothetical protein